MSVVFEQKDFDKISVMLGVSPVKSDNSYTWKLVDKTNNKPLVFSIFNEVEFGGEKGALISVQTQHGYYELHDCKAFMFFEPDEIIFIHYNKEYLSCIIIGSNCSCNLFSNIRRDLINSDLTKLDPALLLSAMQLSITDALLED